MGLNRLPGRVIDRVNRRNIRVRGWGVVHLGLHLPFLSPLRGLQAHVDARRPLENEMNAEAVTIELDQWERAEYRKHVGLSQYVVNDSFDLKYAVKEVRRDAARPTMVSLRMVKRIVRFLTSSQFRGRCCVSVGASAVECSWSLWMQLMQAAASHAAARPVGSSKSTVMFWASVDHAVHSGSLQWRERVRGDSEGHRNGSLHKELVERGRLAWRRGSESGVGRSTWRPSRCSLSS